MDHRRDNKCTQSSVCAKCWKSNYTELECQNYFNCINCIEHCILTGMWSVEKRITKIKYTRKISFSEARNIEQTQEKEQSCYAYITKRKQGKRIYEAKTGQTKLTN